MGRSLCGRGVHIMARFLHIDEHGNPGFYSDDSGPTPPVGSEIISDEFHAEYFLNGAGWKTIVGEPGARSLADRPKPPMLDVKERALKALSERMEKQHKLSAIDDIIRREIFYPESVSAKNSILNKIALKTKEPRAALIVRLKADLEEKDTKIAALFDKENDINSAIKAAKTWVTLRRFTL